MSLHETQNLKGLRAQLEKANGELQSLKTDISIKQKEANAKLKTVQILEGLIADAEGDGKIIISDHAIVRYLERVKGVDIEEIKAEIISEKLVSYVEKLGGSGAYPINNFHVKMKNHIITTITT